MPPKRAAMSDEAKEAAFQEWMGGPEYASIMDLQKAIEKDKEIAGIDRGTEDIWQDWTDVCNKWNKLTEALRIAKKAKSKEN